MPEKILLDTSFIISCIRNKIDFMEELNLSGRKILLPIQVLKEIEKISQKGKGELKREAELALRILREGSFEKVDLKSRSVDEGLKKFSEKDNSIIIATLDRGVKKPKSRNMVITRKKRIEIV